MSTTTVAKFRGDFPEFSDAAAFPDTQVQFYLDLAETRLDAARWADLWSYGVELYTAHSLAMAKQRAATAVGGAAPGATTGIVSSKSVGGVSKSMNLEATTVGGAATFNLTSYGTEYYQLMQTIGIGGIQVGAGADPLAQGVSGIGGFGYPFF